MIDVFNPQISVVSKGIEGKTFLFYGSNSLGKTKQATKANKPYYLAFERGINAVSGIPFAPILKWADFVKVRKQLTNEVTLDKAKELYSTIICDTVDAMATMCKTYVAKKHGADSIKSGNDGYGLWEEYKTAFWEEINILTNCGYTVIFIGHEDTIEITDPKDSKKKIKKTVPKGDSRSMTPIVDLCDVVVCLKENEMDSDGNEVLSSAYMTNTPYHLCRSRFDYMSPYLETFTLENLEADLIRAIEEEEKATNIKSVTFKEQSEQYQDNSDSYEEIVAKIKEMGKKLKKLGRMQEYTDIAEKSLGKGKKLANTTKEQKEQLEVLLFDLEQLEIEDVVEETKQDVSEEVDTTED